MTVQINRLAVLALMARRGIESQRELAERTGLHETSITRMMRGGSFTSSSLAAVCEALECSPHDVIDRTGHPDPIVSVGPVVAGAGAANES